MNNNSGAPGQVPGTGEDVRKGIFHKRASVWEILMGGSAEEPGEGEGYRVMGGKGIPTGKHPPARWASWCQIRQDARRVRRPGTKRAGCRVSWCQNLTGRPTNRESVGHPRIKFDRTP